MIIKIKLFERIVSVRGSLGGAQNMLNYSRRGILS